MTLTFDKLMAILMLALAVTSMAVALVANHAVLALAAFIFLIAGVLLAAGGR